MDLKFPISSDLITFMVYFNSRIAAALHVECGLNVTQYRLLSCVQQGEGVRSRDIVKRLAISPSSTTKSLAPLVDKGLLRKEDAELRNTGIIVLTPTGLEKVNDADVVVSAACDDIFEPLGTNLKAMIRSGSLITNQTYGIVRMKSGRFFGDYACVEAFFQCELITKKSAQPAGLSETEFRVLFALYEHGPMRQQTLCGILFILPSVVSDICKALVARSLMVNALERLDKRARTLSLTGEGRALVEQAAVLVDDGFYEGIRAIGSEELPLYSKMARIVVHQAKAKPLSMR